MITALERVLVTSGFSYAKDMLNGEVMLVNEYLNESFGFILLFFSFLTLIIV